MREVTVADIRCLIGDVIGNTEIAAQLDENSALLGALPELDSMAVVHLMLGMERLFGFNVDDDEVEVEIFETVGSLQAFAQKKVEQASR